MEVARDSYYGHEVIDPYRSLEDRTLPETQAWIAEQQHKTTAFLQAQHTSVRDILTRLWSYPTCSLPQKYGELYYTWRNNGSQQYNTLIAQRTLLDNEQICLFDLNKSQSHTRLSSTSFSEDGRFLAYGLAEKGSDWQEIHIYQLHEGVEYPEIICGTRASGCIAWHNDGFYYAYYAVMPDGRHEKINRIYFHTLGTPQASDELIFQLDEFARCRVITTKKSDILLIEVSFGTAAHTRWYCRTSSTDEFFLLFKDQAAFTFIGNVGSLLYFATTLNSPRGKIMCLDLDSFVQTEVVGEKEDVLYSALLVGDTLTITWAHDAYHQRLSLYTSQGKALQEISLPLYGSIRAMSENEQDQELFFVYSSHLIPYRIYRYNFAQRILDIFWETETDFEALSYAVTQQFCCSRDGTHIPLFLVHKKNIKLNGKNPALLTGYGGFKLSQWPTFSTATRFWIEHQGIYVIANVRGGGEYGEEWHQAATLGNKQRSIDDLIVAAEWLRDMKYTSPEYLAINGWSNGGLLAAACLVQRPDLFGAVTCGAPLTDMYRFHKMRGIGYAWVKEFGNAEEDEKHFQFLSRYSPYHTIIPANQYPPVLVVAGAMDDRVDPAHALKFIARLQEYGNDHSFLYLQPDTGHGVRAIEMWTIIFAFLFSIFQMKPESNT